MSSFKNSFRNFIQNTRSLLKGNSIRLFPIQDSFKTYNKEKAKKDLKAAADVALVGLPQGMAFAALAGLPIIFGILCATLGTLVAPLFSKSKLTIAGPSNATAFMLASFFLAHPAWSQHEKLQIVPVIVFLVGIFCIIGALFKLTDLMQYVSRSVLVGYISGAALLIIASQIKYLFGLEFQMGTYFQENGGGRTLFSMLEGFIMTVKTLSWQPVVLSALTFTLFFTLKKRVSRLPNFALTLIVMSLLNYLLGMHWTGGFFQNVETLQGFTLKDITLHPPDIFSSNIFNQLYDITSIVVGIGFLCLLEQTLMTKTLASRVGEKINLHQDAYSVGMTNMALSFCTSLPSSASLTRSMLNYTSGAVSRFSSIFCGMICLGITFLLGLYPITAYIPSCVLAALVTANALNLFNKNDIRICFKTTNHDAVVLVCTFFAALLTPLQTAIFIGIGISITLFLRNASRPELVEYTIDEEGQLKELQDDESRAIPAISIVHVEGDLFFGAADVFRNQVLRMTEDPSLKVIILRMRNARNLDATTVLALDELIRYSREHHRHLIISGATPTIYKALKRSGLINTINKGCTEKERNIFMTSASNPNYSTRLALIRAQELLGTQNADIRIFVSPKKSQPDPQ